MKTLNTFKIIALLLVVMTLNINSNAQVLQVDLVEQEQDQWCWIGSSLCVLKYYGDTQLAQCEVADWAWDEATWRTSTDDCCTTPDGDCNYWNYNWYGDHNTEGDIEHILWAASSQVQIDVENISSSISESAVETAIQDGRPMILRTCCGGHFIVVHGLVNGTVYYMDPWFGEGFGFEAFRTNRINGKKWTHTQVCLTTPSSAALSMEKKSGNDVAVDVIIENEIEEDAIKAFNVYPNPASDNVTVTYNGNDNTLLKIISANGALVKEININNGENTVNISDLSKGIYFLMVNTKDKTITKERLIIQ